MKLSSGNFRISDNNCMGSCRTRKREVIRWASSAAALERLSVEEAEEEFEDGVSRAEQSLPGSLNWFCPFLQWPIKSMSLAGSL